MLSTQQIFEISATHLLTQNRKALDELQLCQYRTPTGLKCAIGCLIEDQYYDPLLEGTSVSVAYRLKGELITVLANSSVPTDKSSIEFLTELQDIHDYFSVLEWKENLIQLGKQYNLDISFLTK